MKKTLSLAISAAALAYAPAVSAADFFPSDPEFEVFGDGTTGVESVSATIGNGGLSGTGSDNWIFQIGPVTPPLGGTVIGLGSGSVSTSFSLESVGGLEFTSVTLNNGSNIFPIAIFSQTVGGLTITNAVGNNIPIISGAVNTLTVNYNATGSNASYGGTLNFAPVPEPMTWAMMILGFAVVGFAMRRRRSDQTTRVRYAF